MTSDRTLIARAAGLARHLKGDSALIAANARTGFEQRFAREIAALFPGLSPGSETFRAKVGIARRLYFTRLARASVIARRRRSARSPLARPQTPENTHAPAVKAEASAAR